MYHMTELAIRSVLKMAHANGCPSVRIEQNVLAGKFPS